MNLNKTLGRVATTLVAGAMLTALAMPAYATTGVTGDGETAVSSFTITKHLTKEQKTMTPNVSFSFTVDEATNVEETHNGVPVSDGIDGGVTVNDDNETADFAPGDTLNSATDLTDTVTFDVNVGLFPLAGIYKYTITENDFTYDGITKDTNVLDLYVYIQNGDNGLEVAYTELVDPDGGSEGKGLKTDSFTNDYDSNGAALHDLVVYKVVSGNAANMSESFTFKVKIKGETGEKYYVEIGTYKDGTFTAKPDKTSILSSGTDGEFTLGNGDAIKVYGLDGDDAYTVEELNDNTNGYTLKIDDTEDADGITNGIISADKTIKYENAKNASTPTGIVMNVAPYVLLVVVAAAGCFVFLRKRRED